MNTRLPKSCQLLLAVYFLLILHCYLPNNGGNGFVFPANLVGMMVIACLTLLLLWHSRRNSVCYSSGVFRLMAFSACLLAVPLLWSDEPWRSQALPRFPGLFAAVALYYALLQCRFSRRDRQTVLTLLLAAAVIEALLGLAQYLLFSPDNFMGYNTRVNRPYGIFQQVNVMASFIATGLALALYLMLRARQHITLLLGGSMLLLGPWLLLIIASRIGLLAAFIVTPLQLMALAQRDRRRAGWAVALLLIGAGLGFLSIALNGAGREVSDPTTVGYRLAIWHTTLQMIADRPLAGWGYGHFHATFLESLSRLSTPLPIELDVRHPHNESLLWWMEGGIVTAMAIAVLIFGLALVMAKSLRLFRPGACRRFATSPWLLLVPIVLHTQVELPLYQSAAHALVMLLVLRVCDRRRTAALSGVALPVRYTLMAWSTLLLLYMAGGLWVSQQLVKSEREGLRHLQPLAAIGFPHPLASRLTWDLRLGELLQYQARQDPQILNRYRQWAEQQIQLEPDANLYLNLIAICRLQDDPQAAAWFLQQARRLFPDEQRFR
ncbi:MAG: Wzy polymerase domain-containing protein [Scandinavium sp.]|uniref:PglL family O-oligosaccharyltransferase n=1 Tax=Scandinavium sp. TaxID=2830653 RepID=UPI003F3911B6